MRVCHEAALMRGNVNREAPSIFKQKVRFAANVRQKAPLVQLSLIFMCTEMHRSFLLKKNVTVNRTGQMNLLNFLPIQAL